MGIANGRRLKPRIREERSPAPGEGHDTKLQRRDP
jgi:hypothetical protein